MHDDLKTESEPTHLRSDMTWKAGFAFALTMPASLVAGLGYSVGALGAWGASLMWAATTVVAVLLTRIYTELAAMFPHTSGGISLYADEAWRARFSLVGPLASWGYWVAWTSSSAVFAGIIGQLFEDEFFPGQTWSIDLGVTSMTFPKVVAVVLLLTMFTVNALGVKPTLRFAYATGAMVLIAVATLIVGPVFASRAATVSDLTFNLGSSAPLGTFGVVLVWMYVMLWTVGGLEVSASFTPEYRDGWRDTSKALMSSGAFTFLVYALLPITVSLLLGEKLLAQQPVTFVIPAFTAVIGGGVAIPVLLLIGAMLLTIVAADADGSRVLFGMAENGTSLRQFGRLNRFSSPFNALMLGLFFNLLLVIFISNPLAIIAASNLGYVLAQLFAVSGFLLLRKDRPDWNRPLRLGPVWSVIAAALVVLLVLVLGLGATAFSITGYGSVRELGIAVGLLLLSLVFFAYRRYVQDGGRIRLREQPHGPDDPAVVPLRGVEG